jgi:electron transport complex protein RnfG
MVKIAAGADTVECYRGRMGEAYVGVAFPVIAPNGYSGEIEIMVGVDTAGVVQGIAILQHRETPGLGAKIETEDFRNLYKNKSLSDPEVWDVTKDGGTFRQITGATISSRAVTHAVARGLEFFRDNTDVIFSHDQAAPLAPPVLELKPMELKNNTGADSIEAGATER